MDKQILLDSGLMIGLIFSNAQNSRATQIISLCKTIWSVLFLILFIGLSHQRVDAAVSGIFLNPSDCQVVEGGPMLVQ